MEKRLVFLSISDSKTSKGWNGLSSSFSPPLNHSLQLLCYLLNLYLHLGRFDLDLYVSDLEAALSTSNQIA